MRRPWLVLLAVVLTGCGTQTAGPEPAEPAPSAEAADVVPWELRLAAPSALTASAFDRPPSGLPACEARDLSVTASEPVETPGRGGGRPQVEVDLVVRNDGPPCQLRAEAEGELHGEQGPLPLTSNFARALPGYAPPPPLATGGSASTRLGWSSWCGDDPGRWRAVLSIGSGQLEAPAADDAPVPPCAPGSDGAIYGFGIWTVLNESGQPALNPQSALVGTVTGPDEAPLGGVLPMVLRLHNPTRGPIPLDPCPTFAWSVDQRGPGSFFRASPELELNCPEAPAEVPAGGSVSFALELTLSPAIADGALAPGRWYVTPGLGGVEPRPITVLPPEPADDTGPADCTWVRQPGGEPRVPGLPPEQVPRTDRTAVLKTSRGDITIELAGSRSPCAVAAFGHLVDGDFWTDQPCYELSVRPPQFRHLDCGVNEAQPLRAGFAFPSEARRGQSYPAGTVLLSSTDTLTDAGSLRILYGEATTYQDSFVILGKVTSGLDVVEQVAAGGQKDGDYGGPALPLRIEQVDLR